MLTIFLLIYIYRSWTLGLLVVFTFIEMSELGQSLAVRFSSVILIRVDLFSPRFLRVLPFVCFVIRIPTIATLILLLLLLIYPYSNNKK